MLDSPSDKLGNALNDSSSKLGGATNYSLVELGDTTEDCLGKLEGALDGSLAHLLDLITFIRAVRARFLCQRLLSEAKGVASEDLIVHMSIDCRGYCSSSCSLRVNPTVKSLSRA